jgi:hydrogenase/urease accessory protein HupE
LAKPKRSASIGGKMKFSSAGLASLGFAVSAAVARAHPGHDGHEGGDFTWDFSHLASHPLATAACVLMVGAALWAGVSFLRTRRASRVMGRK